ncbi:MAG: hypothetical protein Q9226_008056 [Calogaya cf. arnoldii]
MFLPCGRWFYGGEAVKQENVSRWVGKVRLFNCYGPAAVNSEASSAGSWIRRIMIKFSPSAPLGNSVVEGPTLARGYLDDLTKTQAAFIKSPHWPQGAGPKRPRRIYKTGDLVRLSSDGTYDFVGRKDLQVKVRGQCVEIREVEHHISTYPGICLSMAARPQSGPYAQILVGVVQNSQAVGSRPDLQNQLDHLPSQDLLAADFDRGKLFQYLMDKFPNYMVPTYIIAVTKLPLSVSGKIDRKIVDAWLVDAPIPLTDTRALCEGAIMVSASESSFYKSLLGNDFLLSAVGLDSIKIIHLIIFIRQQFGVKVYSDLLMDPKSSILCVSRAIADLRRLDRKVAIEPTVDIMKNFQAYRQKALDKVLRNGTASMNIFLTGSTGYLGCRILRQLCQNLHVRRILLHVRSPNAWQALERITKSAKLAGWWNDDYSQKLEIWTGDLAKPKLGLDSQQWKRLCGHGSPQERVTAIIHNGATVNWNANFSALKAANVDSTMDLLTAAADSASLADMVYVSGGESPKVDEDDDAHIAGEIAHMNGYTQTKFLSELLVKEYARGIAPRKQRISIIKPGYIIGSKEDGIAATDDFIWRPTASCARIGSYSAQDPSAWLFVSDVNCVATAISDCCCVHDQSSWKEAAEVVKILGGLPVSEFWSIVKHQLGMTMQSSNFHSWMKQLNLNIDTEGEKHPLWPLLLKVEQGQGRLGVICSPPDMTESDKRRVREAVVKNVDYLTGIGFLSRSNELSIRQRKKAETGFVGKPCAVVA